MNNQINKSQNQTSDELESRLKKWMSLDQVNIKRFGSKRLAKVKLEVMSFGKDKVIESRIPELSRESKKRPSSAIKLSTKIATAILGSIVFGSAMRVFSSNLGGIALPAAYLGGAGLGYCVDFLATTASTNYSRLQYTRSCFEKISTARKRELAQGGNELVAAFYEGQIRTIQSIEGTVFNKQFPIHLTLATIISILEYCASFWIISSQTGSSDSQNTVIQTFIAGLPVAMTWLIAYVKSQTFGIPEYAFELLQSYRSSNLIHWDKPIEEIQALTEQQFFNVATLDAGIASLLDTNPQPKYSTPSEAELNFLIDYYQAKINCLKSHHCILIDGVIPPKSNANEIIDYLLKQLSEIIYITYQVKQNDFIAIKGICITHEICHVKLILDELVLYLDDGQFTIGQFKFELEHLQSQLSIKTLEINYSSSECLMKA